MYELKYNTATTTPTHPRLPVIVRSGATFATSGNWTPASGDVMLIKDGDYGNITAINTLPIFRYVGSIGGLWEFPLTAAEAQCQRGEIVIWDQGAAPTIEQQVFIFHTFGDSAAYYKIDYQDPIRMGLLALANIAFGSSGGMTMGLSGGLSLLGPVLHTGATVPNVSSVDLVAFTNSVGFATVPFVDSIGLAARVSSVGLVEEAWHASSIDVAAFVNSVGFVNTVSALAQAIPFVSSVGMVGSVGYVSAGQIGFVNSVALVARASSVGLVEELWHANSVDLVARTSSAGLVDFVNSTGFATVPFVDSVGFVNTVGNIAGAIPFVSSVGYVNTVGNLAGAVPFVSSVGRVARVDSVGLVEEVWHASSINVAAFVNSVGMVGSVGFANVPFVNSVGMVGSVAHAVVPFVNSVGYADNLGTTALNAVNSELIDALTVDKYTEPGCGIPPGSVTILEMNQYLYKAWRNKSTMSASLYEVYNDGGGSVHHTGTVTEASSIFTRGEMSS